MTLSDGRFVTIAEVADMMGVSRMDVYRLVHSGQLPAVRFGRTFQVPLDAVESAIAAIAAEAIPAS